VHCVDWFIAKDLSGNTPRRLRRNAEALGVVDRVQLHVRDVRATGLPDSSADVVLSSLCLHNLGEAADRADALEEIARILRPGGTVVISDLAHVDDEYAPLLGRLGMAVSRLERVPRTFPPQRLVLARRPE
jgi:ubiquinone/menaquinone biosynthesis C-methylase UbiE